MSLNSKWVPLAITGHPNQSPGYVVRTEWKSAEIWLRREFEWTADKTARAVHKMHHDDYLEIYLNGIWANKSENFTTEYEELEITPEAAASLKPSKNLISIHCRQKSGDQYVGAEISAEILHQANESSGMALDKK